MLTYPETSREMRYGSESLELFSSAFTYEIKEYGLVTENRIQAHHEFVLDSYCLLYILSGDMAVICGEKTTSFGSQELLMFEPFKRYQLVFTENSSVSFYRIAFSLSPAYYQAAFLAMTFVEPDSPRLSVLAPNFSSQIGVLMNSPDADSSAQAHSLLTMVLRHVFNAHSIAHEFPSLRMTAERELARNALEYITDHLRLPLKVSDVSAHLGVSDSYLYKAFLHFVAVPPGRYILHEKAKAAARLLCVERYVIGEVAAVLGYSSLFHFSKSFKSIYGLSPRAYTKAVLRREFLI